MSLLNSVQTVQASRSKVHRGPFHVRAPVPWIFVLSCSDVHERISALEALLPWRYSRVMLLKSLGEVGAAVVGLLLLELALVICMGCGQMY